MHNGLKLLVNDKGRASLFMTLISLSLSCYSESYLLLSSNALVYSHTRTVVMYERKNLSLYADTLSLKMLLTISFESSTDIFC